MKKTRKPTNNTFTNRVIACADLHGNLPEIPACDLLLIAGDVCPSCNHSLAYQQNWLATNFQKWLASLPAKHIVGIAGNHDFIFQQRPDWLPSLPWTYLCDNSLTINGLKIYGTPWQPIFNNWAFNLPEADLAKKWANIPEDTDILLVHGPPYGYGDLTNNIRVGSPSLSKRIQEIRPQIVICGHIHEGYGKYMFDGTLIANGSLLNEHYILTNKLLDLQIINSPEKWTCVIN